MRRTLSLLFVAVASCAVAQIKGNYVVQDSYYPSSSEETDMISVAQSKSRNRSDRKVDVAFASNASTGSLSSFSAILPPVLSSSQDTTIVETSLLVTPSFDIFGAPSGALRYDFEIDLNLYLKASTTLESAVSAGFRMFTINPIDGTYNDYAKEDFFLFEGSNTFAGATVQANRRFTVDLPRDATLLFWTRTLTRTTVISPTRKDATSSASLSYRTYLPKALDQHGNVVPHATLVPRVGEWATQPVPEPASWATLGFGLLAARRLRRRTLSR